MNDYSISTKSPRSMRIGNREFRVFKLRPRDIGEMEAWFRDMTPNPLREAKELMRDLPETVAIRIWEDMSRKAEDWPPTWDSVPGQRLLLSPEGQARFVWICVRRGFPEGQFSLDQARELTESMDMAEVQEMIRLSSPGDPDDPLASSSPDSMTATLKTANPVREAQSSIPVSEPVSALSTGGLTTPWTR